MHGSNLQDEDEDGTRTHMPPVTTKFQPNGESRGGSGWWCTGQPGPARFRKLMTEPVKPGADPRNESSRSSKRQAKQAISKLQASAGVELLLLLVAAPR
jgi:hypothetical protein